MTPDRMIAAVFFFSASLVRWGEAREEPSQVLGMVDKFEGKLRGIAGGTLLEGDMPGRSADGGCVNPAYPLSGHNSDWYILKLIPPPAPCPVQGFVIEQLEAQYNFRRPYTLGQLGLEDKWHLLPYLRAVQDRAMSTRKRRVLLDLGGKDFASSTLWFLRFYPLSFNEVHVFEKSPGKFTKPDSSPVPRELLSEISSDSKVPNAKSLPVPKQNLDSITVHEKFVGLKDKQDAVNITRFIVEELGLTPEDALIVKMDIEGEEWNVLNDWLKIPAMSSIVDELFVEIHYKHPSMQAFNWDSFRQTREDAVELFERMRSKGYFLHAWP